MSGKRKNRGRRNRNKPYIPAAITKNPPISTSAASSPTGRAIHSMTFFSGPLPPAEMLHQYEMLLPGSADRIFKMTEQQSEHRRLLEKRIIISDIVRSYFGMACALTVSLFGMYMARDIVLSGNQITGALFGFGALAALVGAFLKATHDRKEIIAETRKQENSTEKK